MTATISNYAINLNSANRLDKSRSADNSSFKVGSVIPFDKFQKVFLTLPLMVLPPSINNISSFSGNNTLTFTEDTIPSTVPLTMTVSIPSGNYNINTFQTAITAAMTAESALNGYAQSYTSSYDTATGKLTISMVGLPLNFQIKAYTFQGQDQDLKQFMGFSPEYNNFTVLNNNSITSSFTSYNSVNFAVPDAIYVRCSITRTDTSYDTSNNQGQGGPSNILRIIPVSTNGYTQVNYVDYEGIEQIRQEISSNNLINSQINIFLTSSNPNFRVDLGGYDWLGVLMVNYTNATK